LPLTAEAVFCEATATLYRCRPREKAIRGFPKAMVTASCLVGTTGLSVGVSFIETTTGRRRRWGSSPTPNLRLAFATMLILANAQEVSPNLPTAILTRMSPSNPSGREAIVDLVGGREILNKILEAEPPEIKRALVFSKRLGAYTVFDSQHNPLSSLSSQKLWEMAAAAMSSDQEERSEPALPTFADDFLTALSVKKR
jgi:hypothetical protein